MDFLDDFDSDSEELFRQIDGGSGLQVAPVASRVCEEYSVGQLPHEQFRYGEDQSGQPASPGQESVDAIEDLDDAAINEALQNNPGMFSPQNPSHGQVANNFGCTDDLVLDEYTQTLEGREDQAAVQAECGPQQMSDTVHGKQFQDVYGDTNVHTSYDEQEMWLMESIAFEEPDCREPELRPDQIPKQPGDSSLNTQALSAALRYAYENALTSDHLLTSFSLSQLLNPLIQSTIPKVNDDGFTDHKHLAHAQIPNPVVLDKSKPLTMTREALRLIDEARFIQNDGLISKLTEEVSNAGKLTHIKLELPILRTDNERDMTAFRKRYLNNAGALLRSIKEHRLPLHPQNLADGEGMELSSKARAECEMMQKKSKEEKIVVTKESLTYLFSLLKDEYTAEDRMRHIIDEIQYKKARLS